MALIVNWHTLFKRLPTPDPYALALNPGFIIAKNRKIFPTVYLFRFPVPNNAMILLDMTWLPPTPVTFHAALKLLALPTVPHSA